ncbi:MAG TPA: M48 family metalloprotease [Thermoanaerobaculia bacterium]
MRTPRARLCCALFLLSALAVPGSAQEPDIQEELDILEDLEDASRGASLNLRFDSRGNADLDLGVTAAEQEILARLRGALPCRIKPDSESEPFGGSGFVSFSGRCEGLLRRKGTLVQGRIDFAPALRAFGSSEDAYLTVMVEVPPSAFFRCPGGLRIGFGASPSCNTTFRLGKGQDTTLALSYGYRDTDLLARFGVLAAVLVLPVFLVVRRGRKVRAAADEEPATVWFGFWRAQQMILQLGWLLWIVAFYTLRLDDWLLFLLPGDAAVWTAILAFQVVPPALVALGCHLYSGRLFARMEEVDLSPGELASETLSTIILPFFAVSLSLIGITLLSEHTVFAAVTLVAAFLIATLAPRFGQRATRTLPHAVTVGPLRDRVFEMAQRIGVKLNQVYVIPGVRTRFANAFATSGNDVLISDFLLARLSRREVDAVLAHELAHLRHRHPGVLWFVMSLGVWLGARFMSWILETFFLSSFLWKQGQGKTVNDLPFDLAQGFSLFPLLFLAGLAITFVLSRGFERSADAYAAMLTGDPEAVISALGKIARLGLQPLRWGRVRETLSTHPSMIRRGEALALRHGISFQRMENLLNGEEAVDGERYEIPAPVMEPERVFTSAFKAASNLRMAWVQLLILAGTSAGAVAWVDRTGLSGSSRWEVYGVCLLAGYVALLVSLQFLSPLGYEALGTRLAARLTGEGIDPTRAGGRFVGFGPHGEARSYEGHTVWDVGFVFLGPDALVYAGDQTRFRLRREEIAGVRLGAGSPSPFPLPHLYIDWRDASGRIQTLYFRGRGKTLFSSNRATKRLAAEISAWRTSGAAARELPAGLAGLERPVLGEVTGQLPVLRWNTTISSLWLLTWMTFLVGMIVGLGFGAFRAIPLTLVLYFLWLIPSLAATLRRRGPAPPAGVPAAE